MTSATAIPVLMYHHVSPNPGLATVAPACFAAQMAGLTQAGYATLGADDFLAFFTEGRAVPQKSVLITFDDGYLDNYVHAFPILRRHQLRATIFAITGRIGDGAARACAEDASPLPDCPDHRGCKAAIAAGQADTVMLRWSEIERMRASNTLEIHSHTHEHRRWDREYPQTAERLAALEEDLTRSRETLKARLGIASRHLCWPWGHRAEGYTELAEKLGFTAQYSTLPGANTRHTDRRYIHRFPVKDRAGNWLPLRLWIYRHPTVSALYRRLHGG